MKPEDRKRLIDFWRVKGLLLTGAITGIIFVIIRIQPFLNLSDSRFDYPIETPTLPSHYTLIFIMSIELIVVSFLLRNPYPLSYSGHLLFPEETIAELIALKRRRQKQNLPHWKLLLELTTEVLLLLWAIHIQVRFQNLSLPPSKKRNID
jgi:hypothetical protein